MVYYIAPPLAAYMFAAGNVVASAGCWYTSGRRQMIFTGAVNSAIAASGAAIYDIDPFLGNAHISGAAISATFMYLAHGARCPALWLPTLPNACYYACVVALLCYANDRTKWAWALRYD